MSHRVNRRLASFGHARQVEIIVQTDNLGERIDRAALSAWNEAKRVLASTSNAHAAAQAIARIFHDLIPTTTDALTTGFSGLVLDSWRTAADAFTRTLPAPYLQFALARHQERRSLGLTEDFADDLPGFVTLSREGGEFTARDRLDPFRNAPNTGEMADRISRLLFPPPDQLSVFRFVRNVQLDGETWAQRWHKNTSRFDLARLAHLISNGYSQGKNQRQIASDLLPVVDGVRSAARRIARTYGMALGHEMQMETSRNLGPIVAGYQVHATLDQHTRPEHRHRDGNIYYFNPGPGQRPMSECPHPPREADGSTAWCCRCFLTSVLTPVESLQKSGPQRDLMLRNRVFPDPVDYAEWFQRADVRRRRLSVGAARYHAGQEVAGKRPGYEVFIDFNGRFLTTQQIAAETPQQRQDRVAKIRAEEAHRRELIQQTAMFGFA